MAHFTFRGGLELREKKERTKNLAIEEVLPGKTLKFLLNHQEKPVVIPGEHVLAGQLIARSEDDSMSRVHCSVSGIIKEISQIENIYGRTVPCIVVENDEEYKEVDFGDFVEAEELEHKQILARILSAGVIDSMGDGGPVWRKADVKEPHKIRHIIVNCVESEPYLTSKYRLAVERPEWIIEGLRILLKMFPNAKGILAVENGQQEAITSLQKIIADSKNMKIIPMKRKYPQDTERMLIYSCTGKMINSSKTAEDARCIVLNSDTVYAICNAVVFGKPTYKHLITVSGECIESPKNMEVSAGMMLSELVEATGNYIENPNLWIVGGPMRGTAVNHLEYPVTGRMSGLLALRAENHLEQAGECIGCGYCVDVCNEQLLPTRLAKAAIDDQKDLFIRLGGMECCECGSCSYICPSSRNLTHMIQLMKKKMQEEG